MIVTWCEKQYMTCSLEEAIKKMRRQVGKKVIKTCKVESQTVYFITPADKKPVDWDIMLEMARVQEEHRKQVLEPVLG